MADAKNLLIGNDGAIYIVDGDTEVIGDGTKTLDEFTGGASGDGSGAGFYEVTSKATSSSELDELSVGQYFYNDGSLILVVGDNAKPIVLDATSTCDASLKSFELAMSKDKIEMTVLCDKIKTYRTGRTDVSGTLTGITSANDLRYLNPFLDVLEVAEDGTFTMSSQTDGVMYMLGFLNKEDVVGGKKIAVMGKIQLENGSISVADASAQEFSSSFSPVSGSKMNLIDIEL